MNDKTLHSDWKTYEKGNPAVPQRASGPVETAADGILRTTLGRGIGTLLRRNDCASWSRVPGKIP